MEINNKSSIEKSSTYKSISVAQEQIVIDINSETVIALSGDIVVTRGKESFLNKRSPVNRIYDILSAIEKDDINSSVINKSEIIVTKIENIKTIKSFVSQTDKFNSRTINIIITNSMLEKQYESESLIGQTFIVKSKITKEVIGEALY